MIAMGCASGQVIADSFYDQLYTQLLRKRWGLLLELPYPEGVPRLRHGTMDVSYMAHYAAEHAPAPAPPPQGLDDVTFTACTSTDGMLLLGACSSHRSPGRGGHASLVGSLPPCRRRRRLAGWV